MSEEFVKATIQIPIAVGKPNRNGTVFTKEAVENAVSNIPVNMPIIYRDNKSEYDNKVIGATIGKSHVVTWDSENQVYKLTVDGVVFYGGAAIIVNEITDGKISDFSIVSIGLTT